MYGLVLMAAFAPGADPLPVAGPMAVGPVAGPVAVGCTGCSGSCSGSCYGSCTGSCYGSCTGSCYGSCYGSCHGGRVGLFARLCGHKHSCHGCCGGCYGSCTGWSCFGSCTGSCYGSGYGMGYGMGYGAPYGFGTLSGTPWQGHAGCWGGCWGNAWGAPTVVTGYGCAGAMPGATIPVIPMTGGAGTGTGTGDTKTGDNKGTSGDTKTGDATKKGSSANIKFRLPADAKLYVDGQLTTLTGTERAFVTPPLTTGKYFYDVKAELVVDGKPVVEEKRVIVEPGADLEESFTALLLAANGGRPNAVAGK
jgi:uncharacterized protein (TIGR03000 family)